MTKEQVIEMLERLKLGNPYKIANSPQSDTAWQGWDAACAELKEQISGAWLPGQEEKLMHDIRKLERDKEERLNYIKGHLTNFDLHYKDFKDLVEKEIRLGLKDV